MRGVEFIERDLLQCTRRRAGESQFI